MHSHEIRPDPPGGWLLHTLPLRSGTRRVLPLKRLTHAVLQGRIHQPTHGHDPQEGHDPLGCVEVARGGRKLGIFQAAKPALPMRLAGVGVHQLWRWQLGGIEFVGRQDDTPVLVDAGVSGRTRGDQGPRALVDPLIGLPGRAGGSPTGPPTDPDVPN